MQEAVNNMGRFLKRGRIDSKKRHHSSYFSGMNRTRMLVELGAHLARDRTEATGKTGKLQIILDLNRKQVGNSSGREGFSRHIAVMLDKELVTVIGRLMRDSSEKTSPKKIFA